LEPEKEGPDVSSAFLAIYLGRWYWIDVCEQRCLSDVLNKLVILENKEMQIAGAQNLSLAAGALGAIFERLS